MRRRRHRAVPTLVRLGWRAHPRGMFVLFGASFLDAAAAIGGTLAVGLLLNSLIETGEVDATKSWLAFGVMGAIFGMQRVAFPFLGPTVENLEHRLTLLLQQRVMTPLLRPSTISHLEDPEVADELRMATTVGSESFSAQQALGALNELAGSRLAAIGAGVLLGTWRWWAPLVIGGAWLCSRVWYRRQMATLVASMERSTSELRHAEYLGDLLLGGKAAKEVRIFGVTPWLVGRFQTRWLAGMTTVWGQRRRGRFGTLFVAAVLFAAHVAVLGLLVRAALARDVGAGSLFIFAQAALGMVGLGFQAENEYILRLGSAPLPHVLAVEDMVAERTTPAETPVARRRRRRAVVAPAPPPRDPSRVPLRGIRFEGVSFAYPGTDRLVLDDLNLTIPAGRSLAVVGENGAGKSTLVNLLCGFYQPTGGRITIDGVALNEYDTAGWQRRFAAVFQDYGRYPVTLRENVTFGRPERANDYGARIRAAEQAGLPSVVDGLPKHWYTLLSREFTQGAELSGGQWQRVALARALFALECGAGMLVLDEPTAHLDVRAEADLYNRFLDLTAGATTVLVSHRFSTVRRAERIAVLAGGRVAEFGTHDRLVAQGGMYARMFDLQARYYAGDGPAAPAGGVGTPAGVAMSRQAKSHVADSGVPA